MGTVVGKVLYKEKKDINEMYEKKVALQNLLVTNLDHNTKQKVIEDLNKINELMGNWWKQMGEKYNWNGKENGYWQISFESGEITLV